MEKVKIDKLLDEYKLMELHDYFYFDNKEFLVETNNGYHQLYDVHKVKVCFDECHLDYVVNFRYNNNLTINISLKGIKEIEIKDMYHKIVTNGIYVKIKCTGTFDPEYVTTGINNITAITQYEEGYEVLFKYGLDSVIVDKETAEELINLVYMDHNHDY